MYGLAGYISEQLKGGTKWEDLVRTHILDPLGMASTRATGNVEDWSDVATPYVLRDDTLHSVSRELLRYLFNVISIISKLPQKSNIRDFRNVLY